MQRIMIIGCGGSGKSTLAKRIHQKMGLPLIHLDQHYWHPGWVESPKADWNSIVQGFADQEYWVIDGNYGGTMDIRLQRATMVIFLDRSAVFCLWRIFKRRLQYRGVSRPDVAEGCPERITWEFIFYILGYNHTRRPRFLKKLQNLPAQTEVRILKSNRAVQHFLKELSNNSNA
ncbi:MAG: DNA topology modulation protein [Bacteroidota bacterium]